MYYEPFNPDETEPYIGDWEPGEYEITYSNWYKEDSNHKIWRIRDLKSKGMNLFSFDKKKIYNMWTDYPYKLTDEQIEIFKREQPYWAKFFSSRLKEKRPTKK